MNKTLKGGGKNRMNEDTRKSYRATRPSVRKSAVMKDKAEANAAATAKKIALQSKRNAREAKRKTKNKLAANVNNLADIFSGASLKQKNNANKLSKWFSGLTVKGK